MATESRTRAERSDPKIVPASLAYTSLEEAFPAVAPGVRPFGNRVLVQIRTPMSKTKSGFVLPQQVRETELWNTQVAKVISCGPTAFCDRDNLQQWPEGPWCEPGMYVRVPKYGGDRWEVPVPGSADLALFVLYADTDIQGAIEGNPLDQVAYLK